MLGALLLLLSAPVPSLGLVIGNQHLTLDSVSENHVSGRYWVSPENKGIVFVSEASHLWIKTLKDDTNIIHANQIVDSEGAIMCVLIEIGEQAFLQYKGNAQYSGDYSIDSSELNNLRNMRGAKARDAVNDMLQRLHGKTELSNAKIQSAIAMLLQHNTTYIQHIIDTTIIMGGIEALTGYDYPVLQKYYATAMRLEQALRRSSSYTSTVSPSGQNECGERCLPCGEDGCLGQCGYSCSCWSWICGDCCFHQGCHQNQLICRDDLFSLGCLFPIGFSCSGHS